jgi:hypothetical protein
MASIGKNLSTYRYEAMLFALLLLVFDKVLFSDKAFYLQWVWPFNMVLLSVAGFGIFHERSRAVRHFRNTASLISIILPFLFLELKHNLIFVKVLICYFIFYYTFIFGEVLYQITRASEVRVNVVLGSMNGYLLLSMMALFSFMLIEIMEPTSFRGITTNDIPKAYTELSYFSLITLTSIGYGDITPFSDTARLVVSFFGMAGQFYMAAVVGIVIAKFTSKHH